MAESYPSRIYLSIDPSEEDALPSAVAELISASRRRFWTVEWLYDDDEGWDVYAVRPDGE